MVLPRQLEQSTTPTLDYGTEFALTRNKFGFGYGSCWLKRYAETIPANSFIRISFNVPVNRIAVLKTMRFGNISPNILSISFEQGWYNIISDLIDIDAPLLNHPTDFYPMPYANQNAVLKISNSSSNSTSFVVVFDIILLDLDWGKKLIELGGLGIL